METQSKIEVSLWFWPENIKNISEFSTGTSGSRGLLLSVSDKIVGKLKKNGFEIYLHPKDNIESKAAFLLLHQNMWKNMWNVNNIPITHVSVIQKLKWIFWNVIKTKF